MGTILLFLFTMEINSLRLIAYYNKSITFSSLGNTNISNQLKEMQSQVQSVIVVCPSFHELKSSHNNIYGQCYQSTFHRHWIRASSNNLPQFTTLPITPQHLFTAKNNNNIYLLESRPIHMLLHKASINLFLHSDVINWISIGYWSIDRSVLHITTHKLTLSLPRPIR